jgi:hypothetical protein
MIAPVIPTRWTLSLAGVLTSAVCSGVVAAMSAAERAHGASARAADRARPEL